MPGGQIRPDAEAREHLEQAETVERVVRRGDDRLLRAGRHTAHLAQFARLGHVADRMARIDQRLALLAADHLPQRIEDRGVDAARMHGVAADGVFLFRAIERHALAEQPHRALAGGIGGRAGRADDAGDRRDVDDRAPGLGLARAGLLHALDGVLAAEEHALGVDRLHLLPRLDRGVLDVARAAGDAGVVHHDVEAAFPREHVVEQLRHFHHRAGAALAIETQRLLGQVGNPLQFFLRLPQVLRGSGRCGIEVARVTAP